MTSHSRICGAIKIVLPHHSCSSSSSVNSSNASSWRRQSTESNIKGQRAIWQSAPLLRGEESHLVRLDGGFPPRLSSSLLWNLKYLCTFHFHCSVPKENFLKAHYCWQFCSFGFSLQRITQMASFFSPAHKWITNQAFIFYPVILQLFFFLKIYCQEHAPEITLINIGNTVVLCGRMISMHTLWSPPTDMQVNWRTVNTKLPVGVNVLALW